MALPNTLTNLIPTIYTARDQVSRELTGFIPAVNLDANSTRAAKDQVIRSAFVPSVSSAAVTPGVTVPAGDGQTIPSKTLTIDTVESVLIPYSGEEALSLNESGVDTIKANQISQAMRTLVNKVELSVAGLHKQASRGIGAAATNPFASTVNNLNYARQILVDNGSGTMDLQAVINTTAGAALRNLTHLTGVNTSGSDTLLRQGILLPLFGVDVRESAQVVDFTKGTGAAYAVDNIGGYAIGATTIHVDTGTGTFLPGDCITFAGDTNIYVVKTGFAGDGDGDIVLQEPGLKKALANDVLVTFIATHSANMVFRRGAIGLAIRPPAMGADLATDSMLVTDPVSGITFDIRTYPGYGMSQLFVGLAWGCVAWKPEHIAKLIG